MRSAISLGQSPSEEAQHDDVALLRGERVDGVPQVAGASRATEASSSVRAGGPPRTARRGGRASWSIAALWAMRRIQAENGTERGS